MSPSFNEIKHAARMAGGAPDAGDTSASFAPAATHMAMMAAISVFTSGLPKSSADEGNREYAARFASQTVGITAIGFLAAYDPQAAKRFFELRDPKLIRDRELAEVERVAWSAALEDIQRLENGTDNSQSLLMLPLWLNSIPEYISADWQNLSARLLQYANENWGVWIDWYEVRLAGRGQVSESAEVGRVSLPNDVWAQGPAAANARISTLSL